MTYDYDALVIGTDACAELGFSYPDLATQRTRPHVRSGAATGCVLAGPAE